MEANLAYRPLMPGEARAMLAGVPNGQRWAPGFPTDGDRLVAAWILDGRRLVPTLSEPWGPWVIALEGVAVGGIGCHEPPDSAGTVEIGYGIAEPFRRRGIASAAVRWITGLAFTAGAGAVQATCLPENVASAGVLARVGFRREGSDADGEDLWVLRGPPLKMS